MMNTFSLTYSYFSVHPTLVKVSPSKADVRAGDKLTLHCFCESHPVAEYTWLQQLTSGEVLIRGYEPILVIQAVTFEHSGEFVCKARNVVKSVKKEVQSSLIKVSVKGSPQILDFKFSNEIVVKSGDNVDISVPLCSNPSPSIDWIIVSGKNMISLTGGTRYGRFTADIERDDMAGHCYHAILRIMGAHPSDSNNYILEVENDEGGVKKSVKLSVIDESPKIEFLIAIIVGIVITILLITLVIVYTVKANSCSVDKTCKSETGSNQTDTESCHSNQSIRKKKKAIPPDAVYAASESSISKVTANPDLLNIYSEILNPLTTSEKLRRKEFKSQGVHCQLKSGYNNHLVSEESLKKNYM